MQFNDLINSSISHMEMDQFIPDNILFSAGTSLYSTDGNITSLIVGGRENKRYAEGVGGSVAFDRCICGFNQLNATHVILTDIFNHCHRILNRCTNQTSLLAGNCTNSGDREGIDALYNVPSQVMRDARDSTKLLFTDQNSRGPFVVRELDMETGNTSTFYTSPNQYISALANTQDCKSGDLFVTPVLAFRSREKCSIYRITYDTNDWICVSEEAHGFIQNIVLINNRTELLLIDMSGRLVVFDTSTNTTTILCRQGGDDDSLCRYSVFTSLLVHDDTLYLGTGGEIVTVKGKLYYAHGKLVLDSFLFPTILCCQFGLMDSLDLSSQS